MKPILIVVTGPTASGKTALAIELARHFDTEIISADSRQIYRDIPIGTAAPTSEERCRAFHHLVGTHRLDEYYSASRFEEDSLRILSQIYSQKTVAVVCGGSMMYIDALLYGMDEMPTVSDSTRQYVLALLSDHGPETVLAQLRICDPNYYEKVDKSNTRRIVHALEVSLEAHRPYSSFLTGKPKERPFEPIKFAIDLPREVLFARINSRVDAMIAAGLEDEARRAFSQGTFNSLNTVGYKEMKLYFDSALDRETAIARIAKNTRVFAKKQLTWLKNDNSICWLSPEDAIDRAISIVEETIFRNCSQV